MLRIATEADIPAMLDIYRPYVLNTTITFEYDVPTVEEFTHRFRQITARFPWLVWEEEGRILGYAYGSAPFARAAYSWCAEDSVYLEPEARGRGIGRRLLTGLETVLAMQGFQVIYAIVTQENENSLAFHSRMGYRPAGYYEACGFKFGRWLSVRWLEKRLKSSEIPDSMPIPWNEFMRDVKKISQILYKMSIS